ncbi:MAG: ABC transporter ATP-binding protein/permease [Bacilli bacterium]|nr:ABC transporter ATP-binding protein/permease [Bacilli bacterium]
MLKLKNIKKNYKTDFGDVEALKGITLNFRKSEFVSILGPSGCGKTTLLNIIGGLDRYTSGDLLINGKSTEDFNDRDWDNYRNHSVGFVFQSYNLIPHLTVFENVELALTLSGVKKEKRNKMVKDALEKVGLADKLKVKPNQLSGGQMQRVAIARALVNNPEILLADEPTGALDTKTSIQVLDLLKEIAKERLVIMVTHNPDLAKTYSTRIISLLDGNVISDSNPYEGAKESKQEKVEKKKKTSMSFLTALSLSLKNLLTKKGRTFLVAFAGSIGIIGIATILAISSGFKKYIKNVEEDTLSTYPLTIYEKETNMSSSLEMIMGKNNNKENRNDGKIYSNNIFFELMSSVISGTHTNNLEAFDAYLRENEELLGKYVSSIERHYGITVDVYANDLNNIFKVNPSSVFDDAFKKAGMSGMTSGFTSSMNIWSQMLSNKDLVKSQYDLLIGSWPKEYNEILLVVDKNNEIPDYALFALGLKPQEELDEILKAVKEGRKPNIKESSYMFSDLLNLTFKLVLKADLYEQNKSGSGYELMENDQEYMKKLLSQCVDLKITGIIRPNEDAVAQSIRGVVCYDSTLIEYIINETNSKEIVKKQLANPKVDVFSNLPFMSEDLTMESLNQLIESIPDETQKAQIKKSIEEAKANGYSDEMIISFIRTNLDKILSYSGITIGTYEGNLTKLGVGSFDKPKAINIYPLNFSSKDEIVRIIEEYNKKVTSDGRTDLVIEYTNYIGILMSSISDVIDAVSYVLFAFVAISLVVSSIMIGIITYISVLERIKEIGVLRSVGASKLDISRVFNAETIIIGFSSGVLGILITLLLLIPINIIIGNLANIHNVAKLPVEGAFILIAISVVLSVIAGLIPAITAARKNPVEALRSE